MTGGTLNTSNSDLSEVITGNRDSEPDIYSFHFPGFSGKFTFDGNQEPFFLPEQDLKIEVSGTPFEKFTITAPTGVRYIFGKHNGQDARERSWYNDNTSGTVYTAWCLVRIENYDGNFGIDLTYTRETYNYKNLASYTILHRGCARCCILSTSRIPNLICLRYGDYQ